MREALRRLGEKPDDYGLHSFRAGGASATANAGVVLRIGYSKDTGDESLKTLKMAT